MEVKNLKPVNFNKKTELKISEFNMNISNIAKD